MAWLALTYLPGFETDDWGSVVLVLILAAFFMAIGRWAIGASDNEYVIDHLLRRARRAQRAARGRAARSTSEAASDPSSAGLLVVQLDGVARSTFDHAVQAGLAPNLARWLSEGRTSWRRGGRASRRRRRRARPVFCTARASTCPPSGGGTVRRAPRGDQPAADAAEVEALMSDGRGLLADGGVAVSTMFSGDAGTSLLVMSRARAGLGPGQLFVHFFSSPFVLVRALVATVGSSSRSSTRVGSRRCATSSRASRASAPTPSCGPSRTWCCATSTPPGRRTARARAPVVFVDLVDYDEIAHHAGRCARGDAVARRAGPRGGPSGADRGGRARRYEIVVLSDHGQSLGATFEQIVGRSFLDEVRRLMAIVPAPASGAVGRPGCGLPREPTPRRGERSTPRSTRWDATDASRASTVGASWSGRAVTSDGTGTTCPRSRSSARATSVSCGSRVRPACCWGRGPRALARAAAGARGEPGRGVVVVRESAPGQGEMPDVVAYGPAGSRDLVSGEVHGEDPLAAYGPRAAPDLLRAASLENASDLLLVSSVDDAGWSMPSRGSSGRTAASVGRRTRRCCCTRRPEGVGRRARGRGRDADARRCGVGPPRARRVAEGAGVRS
ncbi:hypothetical protein NKG05_00655 [Oerskovia sp. M15]